MIMEYVREKVDSFISYYQLLVSTNVCDNFLQLRRFDRADTIDNDVYVYLGMVVRAKSYHT